MSAPGVTVRATSETPDSGQDSHSTGAFASDLSQTSQTQSRSSSKPNPNRQPLRPGKPRTPCHQAATATATYLPPHRSPSTIPNSRPYPCKTLSTSACRGETMMRNGTGDRPDKPSYSFRSIGSSGSSVMLKAHSMREIVSQISRSEKIMPGQMRRLGNGYGGQLEEVV